MVYTFDFPIVNQKIISFFFRYSDYDNNVFLYNNGFLLSVDLLVWIRESLQHHTAVYRVTKTLEDFIGTSLPHDKILSAFQLFESLTDYTNCSHCYLCSYHPPILTLDVTRKACFKIDEEMLIEKPDLKYDGEVDLETFWQSLNISLILKSLGVNNSKFDLSPNLKFWAPWIGKETRNCSIVYNTEYCKGRVGEENDDNRPIAEVDEDFLTELAVKGRKEEIIKLCDESGINTKGLTKRRMIHKLLKKLNQKSKFNKILTKVYGCSGGTLTGSCPHGIVYLLKWPLRGESPRDYMDMLYSMKFAPTIMITDMPHHIANHAHKRTPNFFNPNMGRILPATQENIDKAQQKNLTNVEFTFIDESYFLSVSKLSPKQDDHIYSKTVHPLTKVPYHFSLYDKLHQFNTKKQEEILRRVEFVPQLQGMINTQRSEQLHSVLSKMTYFLDFMKPQNHILMTKCLLLYRNYKINKNFIDSAKIKNKNCSVTLDQMGRAFFSGNYLTKNMEQKIINDSDMNESNEKDVLSKMYEQFSNLLHVTNNSKCTELMHDVNRFLHEQNFLNDNGNTCPKAPFYMPFSSLQSLLAENGWLDGEIIDGCLLTLSGIQRHVYQYIFVLPNRFLSDSSFTSYKNWLPHESRYNSCNFVITAAHHPNHWCFACIDREKRAILYLNSLPGCESQSLKIKHLEILKCTAVHMFKEQNWEFISEKEIEKHRNITLPLQSNFSDCGVYLLLYCIFVLTDKKDWIHEKACIKHFRKWLAYILLKFSSDDSVTDAAVTCDTDKWTLKLRPLTKKQLNRGDFILHEIHCGKEIKEDNKINFLKVYRPDTVKALEWLRTSDEENLTNHIWEPEFLTMQGEDLANAVQLCSIESMITRAESDFLNESLTFMCSNRESFERFEKVIQSKQWRINYSGDFN